MGCAARFSAALLLGVLLCSLRGVPAVGAQDLRERDALCDQRGCYVVYFQRKTFLDAWRACKDDGGDLATVKRAADARAIAALFTNADLRDLGPAVRVWIGLQRQPRRCRAGPLRGYSWTTGDEDTEYTRWRREESAGACSVPRCVAMEYDSSPPERGANFEWVDSTCFVPADGYLCRFAYEGMCPALWGEGGGDALYATPFNLLTTMLTHLPPGTMATVPCPAGTMEEQSVLCAAKADGDGDGDVAWAREAPLCGDGGGGGLAPRRPHCQQGYLLAADGLRCVQVDACLGVPCQYECLQLMDGYRCACPEGYMLAPDELGCLDVDECLQSPCDHLCVNSPGSFECSCRQGYQPAADHGECEDVDECAGEPCEQACENTPGSHVCHCHMGFSVSPEDPRHCQETDECQIPGTCQQMCVNYVGGFDCYCEEGYELGADHYSCQRVEDGDGGLAAAPLGFPWATPQPPPDWDRDFYDWGPRWPQAGWPVDVDREDGERVPDGPPWEVEPDLTSSVPAHTPPPPPHTTATTHGTPQRAPTARTTPLTTGPTATPDYYVYEYEETTAGVPVPPTMTVVFEGAWNWFWNSPAPATWEPATTEHEEPVTDYSISTDSSYHGEEERVEDRLGVLHPSEQPKTAEEEQGNGGDQGPGDQGPGDQGPGNQGPGDQGPGVQGPEVQGPGNQGPGVQGPGDQGPGDQGPGDQGPGNQGPGDQGPGVQGPEDQGPGVQGPEVQGPGDQGPGDQGPEVQGPEVQGPGDQGLGDQGPGDQGPEVQGPEVQGPGDQGPGVQGPGDQGPEVQGPEVQGPGDQGPGDQGPGDQGPEVQGPEVQGPGDQGPGVQGPGDQGPEVEGPEVQGPGDQGPGDQGPGDQGPGDQGPGVQRTTPGSARADTAPDQGEAVTEGAGTWLLVGLLVPVCIVVVAMVALGVAYCTRCGVQPRSKSTTDCYHWISGAHDKQSAAGPAAAGRPHV